MNDVKRTYCELFKLANEQVKEAGVLPWLLGGGLLAGLPASYALGRKSTEEEAKRQRNLAFGLGAASGAAATPLIRKLTSAVGLGALPQEGLRDQFTEF